MLVVLMPVVVIYIVICCYRAPVSAANAALLSCMYVLLCKFIFCYCANKPFIHLFIQR